MTVCVLLFVGTRCPPDAVMSLLFSHPVSTSALHPILQLTAAGRNSYLTVEPCAAYKADPENTLCVLVRRCTMIQ